MKSKSTSHPYPPLILLLAFVLAACSSNPDKNNSTIYSDTPNQNPSVVSSTEYQDPLEPVNRAIFSFNDFTYRYFLTPVSKGYHFVVPSGVRRSIGNLFSNLREPLNSFNQILQGKPKQSGKSLVRFGVNSTVGLLGLFDPAEKWLSIEENENTFGDNLAYYGVGYGGYLVLPILGPSDFRSTSNFAFDYFAHPINLVDDNKKETIYRVTEGFHDVAPTLIEYPKVVADKEDPYIFVRNLYLQGLERDSIVAKQKLSTPESNNEN